MIKSKKLLISLLISLVTMIITASLSVSAAVTEITAAADQDVKLTISDIAFTGTGSKSAFGFKFTGLNADVSELTGFNIYFKTGTTAAYAITSTKYNITNDEIFSALNVTFKTIPRQGDSLIFKNRLFTITYVLTADNVFSADPPNPTITVKGSGANTVFSITAQAGGAIYFTDGTIDNTTHEYRNLSSFNLSSAKISVKLSDLTTALQSYALRNGKIQVFYKNPTKYGMNTTTPTIISIAKGVQTPTPAVTKNDLNRTVTIKAKGLDNSYKITSYLVNFNLNYMEYIDAYEIPTNKISFTQTGTAVISYDDIRRPGGFVFPDGINPDGVREDDGEYNAKVVFTITKTNCVESIKSPWVQITNMDTDRYLTAFITDNYGPNDTITIQSNWTYTAKVLLFATPESSNTNPLSTDASGRYFDEDLNQYVISPYYTGISANVVPGKDTVIKINLAQYENSMLFLDVVNISPNDDISGYMAEVAPDECNNDLYVDVAVYYGDKTYSVVISNCVIGHKYSLYNSNSGASKTITASDTLTVISGLKYSQGFDSFVVSHSTLPTFERLELGTGTYYWNLTTAEFTPDESRTG